MSEATNSEPKKAGPRNAPLDLWRIAQSFLCELYMLFASPDDVARQHTLTHKEHSLMRSWLQAGEALLRRLLLIEAAALPELPPVRPRASRRRAHKPIPFAPDDPDSWRVSFPLTERGRPRPRVEAARAKLPAPQRRFFSAWPLAKRYEAFIRVFNEPLPYARRLARRLRADPRRVSALLTVSKRVENLIGVETLERLEDAHLHATRTPACADTS